MEASRYRIQEREAPTGGGAESPSPSESPLGNSRCCSPVSTWQAGLGDTSHPWAYSEKSRESQAHFWTFEDVKLPQGTQHLLHPTVPIQPQGSCGDQQPREKLREPTLPLNHAAKDTEARRGRRRCPSPMASLSLLLGRGTAPQPP